MATAFVAVPLGAAAFYIYKKYGDNLGQIAAVATIVIVFAVFLTRMRAYSDKYYHARTRWNRMYMCRNCGQRVAG
jgi:asparagine N-glycosylation enzyme membrane subunit Stt3